MKRLIIAAALIAASMSASAGVVTINLDCDGAPAFYRVTHSDNGARSNAISVDGKFYGHSGGTRKEIDEHGDLLTTQFAGISVDDQAAVQFTQADIDNRVMLMVRDHGNKVSICKIVGGL